MLSLSTHQKRTSISIHIFMSPNFMPVRNLDLLLSSSTSKGYINFIFQRCAKGSGEVEKAREPAGGTGYG